jgi:hypothetical protein
MGKDAVAKSVTGALKEKKSVPTIDTSAYKSLKSYPKSRAGYMFRDYLVRFSEFDIFAAWIYLPTLSQAL